MQLKLICTFLYVSVVCKQEGCALICVWIKLRQLIPVEDPTQLQLRDHFHPEHHIHMKKCCIYFRLNKSDVSSGS